MEVQFRNNEGRVLSGRLEFPDSGPVGVPVVVFAHGFGSGKDSPRSIKVASAVREAGIATFLFDFTGHGHSQGTKADSTIGCQVGDLRSAIDFAQSAEGIAPDKVGLNGASSGGLVALMESAEDPRVRALTLRGPRTDGLSERAADFKVPILIMQGEVDPLLRETEAFFAALSCEKELKVVKGADHLFSNESDLETVAESTAHWFRVRFIEAGTLAA